jgi:inner membrane protein
MTGKTHISCGLLIGALSINYFHTEIFTSVTIMTLAVISSIFPDICHTRSIIGRRFKLISFIVRLLFGHRTFTHSLLFMIIIGALLVFIQSPTRYIVTIMLGLISHVILDMLTSRGVKLFYPLPINVRFPFVCRTGGLVDLSLASAITVGTCYVLLRPFIDPFITQWIH